MRKFLKLIIIFEINLSIIVAIYSLFMFQLKSKSCRYFSSSQKGQFPAHGLLIDTLTEISQILPHVLVVLEVQNWKRLHIILWLVIKNLVNCQFESVVQHSWYHRLEHRGTVVDGGVSVYLNKPTFELTVNHKVIAENLKALFTPIHINFSPGRDHRNPNNFSNLGLKFVVVMFRHVAFHFRQIHLVSWFFIVLTRMFLYRVVC